MAFGIRVEVRNRADGTSRGELTRYVIRTLERRLDGPGELTVDVATDDPLAPPRADLGNVEAYVYVDGVLWWGGPLWTARGSHEGPVEYGGQELESYLADRYLEADLAYTQVDQASIVWNLLAHTQGQLGGDLRVVSEVAATGVLRDRYYADDERPNIGELMARFRGYANGVEWAMRVRPDGSRALTTYYPARGQHHANRTLEYGRNVSAFEWSVDGRTVNDVITRGQGDGPSRVEGRYTDTVNRDARGLRTAVQDGGSITEQASLVEASQAEVELRRNPLELLSGLTVRNTPEVPVLGLDVGDTHPVRVKRGIIDAVGSVRIVSLTLDPYAETAELGVQPA